MLRKALALFAIGALFAQTNAQEKAVAKPRAKLAVMLVFDQLRADYLMRYKDLFGPGGFNRFLDKGAWYQEAHYPYAFTVTGPGHASLGTGCPPRVHGIMGNDWRDRVTGSEIYCATTERQKNIPPAPPPTLRAAGGEEVGTVVRAFGCSCTCPSHLHARESRKARNEPRNGVQTPRAHRVVYVAVHTFGACISSGRMPSSASSSSARELHPPGPSST